MTITAMTKLDAVNICLSAMGEPKINSLDGSAIDAQIASDLIDETSRSVQSRGWHWNRDRYVLSPNVSGEIVIPSNTARIDTIEGDRSVDIIVRGGKLYNKADNTNVFTKSLTLEIYVFLEFDDMPYAAKQYITMRAARLFQQRVLGSPVLSEYSQEEERQAYVTLLQDEMEVGDYSMLWDSADTAAIMDRSNFARRY
jgi:hypothetical protein